MRRNVFSLSSAALLVSTLLFCSPGIQGQMMGGPPSAGQNGTMNQPGTSPNNMQPNAGMQQQNNAQSAQEQSVLGTVRRNVDAENELSKLAVKNSSNDNVKKLAQQVISDNRKVQSQLNISLSNGGPTFAAPIPSETRKAEKQMKKMTGTPFDGMYLSQLEAYVKDDQKTASDASLTNSAPDLRDLTMQLRVQADQRVQQIAQVAQSENIKLQ